MSMEEISNDLLMREKAKEIPPLMVKTRQSLPVFGYRDQILAAVARSSVVLIKGSTGCGKSTQVFLFCFISTKYIILVCFYQICQYLLESHVMSGRGANFNCFVSQPRRISAITLAERIAVERGEQLGDSVGFSVRFEGVTPRPYGRYIPCATLVLV